MDHCEAKPNSSEPRARQRSSVFQRPGAVLFLLLVLGVLVRLYGLNAPPVDYQSWRQTQTLMVARNFYRHGMNLLVPSVDWLTTTRDAQRDVVGGTELCVVPYLTAALYHVFGVQFWVGRIAPLLFALLGVYYFYRLAERWSGPDAALVGAFVLTVSPLFVFTGRVQMPESFAHAMAFAALFHYDRWLASDKNQGFWTAAFAAALMLLAKSQLAVMALPMAYLTFERFGWRLFKTPRVYVFAAAVVLPSALYTWYSYAVVIPRSGVSFANAALLNHALLGEAAFWKNMAMSIVGWNLGPALAVVAVVGLVRRPSGPSPWLAHAWFLGAFALLALAPGGNNINSYYQMIFVPPAALVAGRLMAPWLSRPRLRILAAAILVAVAAHSIHIAQRLYAPAWISDYRCGRWIDENAPEDALVLVGSDSPAVLYFADRRGWICWWQNYDQHISFTPGLVNTVRKKGALVAAVTRPEFNNGFSPRYRGVRDALYDSFACHHGEGFVVFALNQRADLTLPADRAIQFGTGDAQKYLRGTWGPDQGRPESGTFVAMGPSPRAFIHFAAPPGSHGVVLDLASAAPGQELAVAVNGQARPVVALPEAGRTVAVPVALPATRDRRYTISLEARVRNERGASVVLRRLAASGESDGSL